MFGWRRRSEGFEWREYVRTTILVRRADRQRRIEDARMAALAKVKNVADVGAEAGRAGVSKAGDGLARLASVAGEALLDVAVAIFGVLARWTKFALAVLGDALGGVLGPLRQSLAGYVDAGRQKVGDLPAFAASLPVKPRHLVMGAGALALILVGGPILRSGDGISSASVVAPFAPIQTSSVTVSAEISGRALAVSGELLRVNGTLVRLDGVEAPGARRPCFRQNGRRWNCAQAARSGLSKIVRGRSVTCTQTTGSDDNGAVQARCTADGGIDIGAELVRTGLVFASSSSTLFSSEEDEARSAKAGLWRGKVAGRDE